MKLMYPDALTEQESIGAPLDKDPECHHTIGASSVIIFLYQHEDPECHHPTLNHLNG